MIIHACLIRYAFKTSLNNTDSHWGLSCFALVVMPMRIKLREGVVSVVFIFSFGNFHAR